MRVGDREFLDLSIDDRNAGWVGVVVKSRGLEQTGVGSADQTHYRIVAGQRFAVPVRGDAGEQTVFDLIPVAGSRRQTADADVKIGLVFHADGPRTRCSSMSNRFLRQS